MRTAARHTTHQNIIIIISSQLAAGALTGWPCPDSNFISPTSCLALRTRNAALVSSSIDDLQASEGGASADEMAGRVASRVS